MGRDPNGRLWTNTASPEDQCEDGWSLHGRACYRAVDEEMPWKDAESACVTRFAPGSHLASIHSDDEKEFVASLSGGLKWIGAQRGCCRTVGRPFFSADGWSWSDGTATDYLQTTPSGSNGGLVRDGGDCGVIGSSGGEYTIGDHSCRRASGFVCKKKRKPDVHCWAHWGFPRFR